MPNMTVRDALSVAVDKWGGRNFIYTRVKDEFVPKTFRETANDAKALAEALLDLGLGGKHILIYGENSYEWCLADLAVMGYVGVTVAASADWKENDLENVVNIADSECVIYAESGRTTIESMKAKKRLIKLANARNVFPDELEELLMRSELIQGAFVYEKEGRILADVVSDGDRSDIDLFLAATNEALPGYKRISQVFVKDKTRQKLI